MISNDLVKANGNDSNEGKNVMRHEMTNLGATGTWHYWARLERDGDSAGRNFGCVRQSCNFRMVPFQQTETEYPVFPTSTERAGVPSAGQLE